jgi:hypothetical protein
MSDVDRTITIEFGGGPRLATGHNRTPNTEEGTEWTEFRLNRIKITILLERTGDDDESPTRTSTGITTWWARRHEKDHSSLLYK